MKNKRLLVLAALLSVGMLAGCNNTSSTSQASSSEATSSEVASSEESSQVEANVPNEEEELSPLVDYVSQLTFNENSGRKFRKVKSVKSLIDGDTSHFYLDDYSDFPTSSDTYSDGIIKVRYLGIDTPESTGQVEEWGKTASKFNKSKLENAESIIVESNDTNWNADSTGSRFLCYVWYRNSATEPYRNLNLELLQEGLCYAKTIVDLTTEYQEAFQAAYSQANSHGLYVFSKSASSYTFDTNMNVIESNGFVIGTHGSTENIIALPKNEMSENYVLKVYASAGKLATMTAITNGISNENYPDFYLGTEINGTVYYYNGEVTKGLGGLTSDISEALKVKIDKDGTKTTTCYNIYTLDTNNVNHYITINSSNNLDYMYRDSNFYYGEYQEVSIKALRANVDSFNGILVRFEGVVTKVSGQTFYVQQEDEETGLTFGMAVYMGYNFTGQSLVVVGNKLSICGTFSNTSDYGAQVSGLTYMRMKPNYSKNTKLISSGNDFTVRAITGADLLNTTAKEEYDKLSYAETMVNTMVTMSDLSVQSVYTTSGSTSSNGAMTLTCKDASGKTVTVRTEVLYDSDSKVITADKLEGKTIDIYGMVDSYNGSYQVRVYTWSDITIK